MKGGIMIPNIDFTTLQLNITPADIAKFFSYTDGDTIFYEITLVRKPITCPLCGSKMIGHGHKLKKISHPFVRDYKGVILYYANRYLCKNCKKTVFETNPFSFPGFNSSFFMLQSVMKKLRNLNYTLQMISDELNISKTQLSKYIDSYITIPPRHLPECLGIDELYSKALSRKNSSYLCILVDNEKKRIYDVLNSRSKHNLSLYFSKIPRQERLKVKFVTIDMWEPYKDVVTTYLPEAIIAVDPFHVIKHLTDNFDRLRLDLMNQCEYGSKGYYLLKNWNWLLRSDKIYLDNKRVYNHKFNMYLNRRDLLNMLLDNFPILAHAYALKTEYLNLNRESTYQEAVEKFPMLIKKFKDSGIPQYNEFTGILINWQEEILNSFKRPYGDGRLSNAFTENINRKIRTYLTLSNGISNFERFRKRVIYALSPDVHYALSPILKSDKVIKKPRGHYHKIRD